MNTSRAASIKFLKNGKIREVKKGEVIAEKIEAIVDDSTKSEPIKDVELKIGDNITSYKLESEKIIFYRSKINGVLYTTKNAITVEKDLRIKSDLNMEIGNLNYSGDIYIEGNVNPGLEIICGGNLFITKSIENGAVIHCSGDVSVGKGIIGRNTIFFSKGNATASFIQETNIRLNGNLNIKDYIYNSYVFSRGSLTVNGNSIHGESHGSVIGSKIISMDNILIHSAGSNSSKTTISCGVDTYVTESINKIKTILPVLERKLIQVQFSIGIDLTHKKSIEKALKLPPVERRMLIDNLTELKKIINYKDQLKTREKELKKIEFSNNINELTVTINKFIKAGVEIIIGKYKKRVSVDQKKVVFRALNNRIIE